MTGHPKERNKLLARVHMAKGALGLDEETYRAMLVNSFDVDSAGHLSPVLLKKLAESLEREARAKQRTPNPKLRTKSRPYYPGRPRNMDGGERAAQLSKIEALLADMALPWGYADGIAKHMHGSHKVAWLNDCRQRGGIITALVKEARRRIKWFEDNRERMRETCARAVTNGAAVEIVQPCRSVTAQLRICPGGPHGQLLGPHRPGEVRTGYDAHELLQYIETYRRRDPAREA